MRVRDTGIGIPSDKLDCLFLSFSQVDSSMTRKYGGSGLGLAISKRLAEMMGGTIWVESEAGIGSTFHVMFTATATTSELYPFQAHEHPDLQDKHVLIVDDNSATRQFLCQYTSQWGMEAHTVSTAETALAWVQQQTMPCDIVLLNLHQTAKETARLAGYLRTACPTGNLPVLALLSLTMRRELNGNDTDITAYLVKPIRPAPLYAALVSIMRGEPIAQRSPFDQPSLLDQAIGQQHPLHILLAEDNLINQKVALQLLAKLGYRADVAATGYEVLEALHRRSYDVILMDVQMPQMDGLEATRRIRATWPAAQQPRIIAMTAHALAEDRQRCIDAGMDDYVGKPVRVEELATKLMQVAGGGMNGECRMQNAECRPTVESQGSKVGGQEQQSAESMQTIIHSPSSILHSSRSPLDATTHAHFLATMGDMAYELVSLFLQDTPQKLATMQQAVTADDHATLRHVAHTLKSSSAQLGALPMSERCKQLELLGKAGTTNGAEELLHRLTDEFARLQETLQGDTIEEETSIHVETFLSGDEV